LDLASIVGLGVLAGVVAIVAALAAPLTRRRRVLRAAAFVGAYCLAELAALAGAGVAWLRRPAIGRPYRDDPDWIAANQVLLTRALDRILGAARRCFGFDVVVTGGPDPTALQGSEPVLVLARHAGPGDSFALVHLLLTRYRRRIRIVLKDVLQVDPGLDVLLNRLGCCFLPGRGGPLADQMAALARELDGSDALLVFPEGGNWTPDRHRRAVDRLERGGRPDAARAARSLPHVLPPRPGGVLAILDARPGIPVVVLTHTGLEHVVGPTEAWTAVPISAPMTVEVWATRPPPADDDGRVAWLLAEWAAVDRWVDRTVPTGSGAAAGPAVV
jgi:1-acyl-sn-glycerol-3-phosphate acyltransferase